MKLEYFNNLLLTLFDKHAAVHTIKLKKKHNPWITENIKLLMKLRDRAKKSLYERKVMLIGNIINNFAISPKLL